MEYLGDVQKQLFEVIQRSRIIDQQVKAMRETSLSRPMISSSMSISSSTPLIEMAMNNNSPDQDESTILADTIYNQHCASVSGIAPCPASSSHLSNSVEGQQVDTIDFLVSMLQAVVQDTNDVLRYAEQVGQANELRDAIQALAYADPVPDYFSLMERARQGMHGGQALHNPIGKFIRYVYSLIDRNAALQRELQKQARSYKASC